MAIARTSRARLQAALTWVGSVLFCYQRTNLASEITLVVATSLGVLAWCFPNAYAPIFRAIDWVNHAVLAGLTWLLLAIVYFGILTPLRVVETLRRKDPLCLRADPNANTYLRALPTAAPGRFDQQY